MEQGDNQDQQHTKAKPKWDAPQEPSQPKRNKEKQFWVAKQKKKRKTRVAMALLNTLNLHSSPAAPFQEVEYRNNPWQPVGQESCTFSPIPVLDPRTSLLAGTQESQSTRRTRSFSHLNEFNPTNSSRPASASRTNDSAINPLSVAIVKKEDLQCKLTQTQADLIQAELLKVLDNFLFNLTETGTPPAFKGWKYAAEVLSITCVDDRSLEWLKEAVAKLPPLWENAQLSVIQMDLLTKLIKATIWIPGIPEAKDLVLRRLAAQNPWARVEEWHTFEDTVVVEEPPGRLLVVGINKETESALSNRKDRLYYRFTTVRVRFDRSAESTTTCCTTPIHGTAARNHQ